jgi:asparagine synthase (glutamine-hydrolysing)
MCGIFGIWHTDGRMVDLAALRRATTSLQHRGPDDEGYLLVDSRSGRTVLCGGDNTRSELGLPSIAEFTGVIGERFDLALGFRRLAILDLSPAGHQPMPSADGTCWLIFNGEVYNYLELRSELVSHGHVFKTGTDSEVILAAYRQWGAECVRRFNGMWAFAIWDGAKRQLLVSRDRFGVKPLYTVSGQDGTFAFASEIKAMLMAGIVSFRPSAHAVASYVAEGVFPDHGRGDTFFEGVQELPGGYSALVSSRGRSAGRYWSLPTRSVSPALSPGEAESRYSEMFTDAVRLRLRADVPVGTCLSGGLDSSSIVAVAGELMQTEHAVSLERLGEHQQTFSAVYSSDGRWNERAYIERVVERVGAAGNYVEPTVERLWDDLERLVWHQDEPFQSTSIFAQWCVMELAHKRGVTVLLDGQGADEVLGGYSPYAVWLGQLLRAGRVVQSTREAAAVRSVTGLNPLPLLARGVAGQLPAPILRRLRGSRVRRAVVSSGLKQELGERLQADTAASGEAYEGIADLNSHLEQLVLEDSLPALLRYEDRNSMAFSIESRVPFLDYRLVEYVFTQASHLRIREGWTKWIQRAAMEKKLPAEVVWRRDKVGFETPEKEWFRTGKQRLLDILHSKSAASDYLDMDRVRREAPGLIDAGETGRVWRWVNLVLWLERFGRVRQA